MASWINPPVNASATLKAVQGTVAQQIGDDIATATLEAADGKHLIPFMAVGRVNYESSAGAATRNIYVRYTYNDLSTMESRSIAGTGGPLQARISPDLKATYSSLLGALYDTTPYDDLSSFNGKTIEKIEVLTSSNAGAGDSRNASIAAFEVSA